MTDNKQPKRQRKKPEKKRLSEQQIVTFGEIFPGFAEWYRSTHDTEGNLLPSGQIPGLRPPEEIEQNDEE